MNCLIRHFLSFKHLKGGSKSFFRLGSGWAGSHLQAFFLRGFFKKVNLHKILRVIPSGLGCYEQAWWHGGAVERLCARPSVAPMVQGRLNALGQGQSLAICIMWSLQDLADEIFQRLVTFQNEVHLVVGCEQDNEKTKEPLQRMKNIARSSQSQAPQVVGPMRSIESSLLQRESTW